MITFRDILIFAGLAAFAAAVIATLFPAGEGVSPVLACSDCAFKLTGGYWIRQYGNYAALYLGTREAARYGWAYVDGRPLSIGESATCGTAMYLWVINGIVYASCGGSQPRFGRDVLSNVTEPNLPLIDVYISTDLSRGCGVTINFDGDPTSHAAAVYVYDEEGRLVASATGTIPGSVSFSIPMAGVNRVRIYVPPLLDEWHTLTAQISITDLLRAQVFTSNNTQDLRPSTSLKIFDLTNYWKRGYSYVTVYMNPWWPLYVTRPADAFADFLLAWEDDSSSWHSWLLYRKEVWRLTFTQSDIVLTRVDSWGWRWHEVYVSDPTSGKTLIWTWNKQEPKHNSYTVPWYTTTVWIESRDSAMNARANFAKECSWG
ncbi:MAG: hypothetical protein ACO2PN_27460 [Pyrobaculum sp.]|jgi:hypothetical protein